MSDDDASSIVLIAMVGNVFSPRWARARRRDAGVSSIDFSTFNVSLRAGGRNAWALTERDRFAVTQTPNHVAIGSSSMTWHGDRLVALVDERSAPFGRPIRGRVVVTPLALTGPECAVSLDPAGLHTWSPRIPVARIQVDFESPRVQFEGKGYFDMNQGQCPLEETFDAWSWSRVSSASRTAIAYDLTLRGGETRELALCAERGGPLMPAEFPVRVSLPSTRFGLAREGRCLAAPMADGDRSDEDPRGAMKLIRTLEDGPFYARSLVATTLGQRDEPAARERATGLHEVVSLERFRAPWVQFLVPFRMRAESTRMPRATPSE